MVSQHQKSKFFAMVNNRSVEHLKMYVTAVIDHVTDEYGYCLSLLLF